MKHQTEIAEYLDVFLEKLGVKAAVKVDYEESDDLYAINIASEDPGVLIGRHGDTLSALQIILAQHLKVKIGEWVRIVVNVNDYRTKREESIKAMADSVAASVVATGRAHALPPLPANERRVVHMYLADHPQVITESQGEGRSRSVVISIKEN